LDDLKRGKKSPSPQITSGQKSAEPTNTPPPRVVEPKPTITIPFVPTPVTQTDNSNFCTQTKNDFNAFEAKYNEVSSKTSQFISIYNEVNSFPDNLTGYNVFQYGYTQFTAKKTIFFQIATDLTKLISELPALAKDDGNLVGSLKSNRLKGINEYSIAYNLYLEVHKNIVENYSLSTVDAEIANLKSARQNRSNGASYFLEAIKNFNSLKDEYHKLLKANGCKGLCENGFAVSEGKCLRVLPKISSLTPTNGAFDTIFSIRGIDFGDERYAGDNIVAGNSNAEIISWTNTEVRFRTSVVLPGLYSVNFQRGGWSPVPVGTLTLKKE